MRSAFLLLVPAILTAQTPPPPDLAAERADFAQWLTTSPVSPLAAIYHQPFTGELTLGPGADPALTPLPRGTLRQTLLRLALETPDGSRTVPRNRDVTFAEWRLRVSGDRARSTVTVYGPLEHVRAPAWYPYATDLVIEGLLTAPKTQESRRMLGLDAVEIEATLAGVFTGRMRGHETRLSVYSMPVPGTEEADLMIFFRDETNGHGTYPAGRFLALQPLGDHRYRADFNRARNPFCAYNGVFPCPPPWPGNAIDGAIEAGERYESR
jgi:Protein of unknown function (DUF1684)